MTIVVLLTTYHVIDAKHPEDGVTYVGGNNDVQGRVAAPHWPLVGHGSVT